MPIVPKIYTRKGDDGTTGLFYGGRVRKDAGPVEANGAVDEAQAALGLARAEAPEGSELEELLVGLERDLWVLMAEVATSPENRSKLVAGKTAVGPEMVVALERRIDDLTARFEMPSDFVVPGQNRVSAALDMARVIVRRAERLVVATGVTEGAGPPGPGERSDADGPSYVGPYLNRLSDLLWAMARWQEGEHLASRDVAARP